MSFTEFYMQSTGDNQNAGSTNSDTASVTSTNGSWNNTTNVFTAASGTPFSGVSAGEWASVYNDGGTSGTTNVSQVVSVGGGGASLTLSSTLKFGNVTSTSATGRTCKIGGAWANLKGMSNTMPAGTTAPLSIRVNVKFGTMAHTTASYSLGMAGTGTKRIVFRGYTSVIGDLDANPTGARTTSREGGSDIPSWTWTSGNLTVFGDYTTVKNIDIFSSSSSATLNPSGLYTEFDRCRVNNAGTGTVALITGSACKVLGCLFVGVYGTAAYVVRVGAATKMISCDISSGVLGVDLQAGAGSLVMQDCLIGITSSHGLSAGSTEFAVNQCSFDTCGGDAIRITGIATNGGTITNSEFLFSGGYDINNTSASNNEARITMSNNSSKSPTSGHTNSMGDASNFRQLTETGTDPLLDPTADAVGAGLPGYREGSAIPETIDIGLQRVITGGGTAGMLYAADMTGGFGG